jgi:hypothetical protein
MARFIRTLFLTVSFQNKVGHNSKDPHLRTLPLFECKEHISEWAPSILENKNLYILVEKNFVEILSQLCICISDRPRYTDSFWNDISTSRGIFRVMRTKILSKCRKIFKGKPQHRNQYKFCVYTQCYKISWDRVVSTETRLRAEKSRVRISTDARDLTILRNVQSGNTDHLTSYSTDTWVLSRG